MKKNQEPKKNDGVTLQKNPFPNPSIFPKPPIHSSVNQAEEHWRINRNLIDEHPLITRAIQSK